MRARDAPCYCSLTTSRYLGQTGTLARIKRPSLGKLPMAEDFDLTRLLRAIAAANQHMQAMYSSDPAACFRYLKTLLDTNDVVVGVYQDGNDVGLHMIKGRRALGAIFAGSKVKNLRFSAIPCTCWQQAIAVEWTLGDGACRTYRAAGEHEMRPCRRATLNSMTHPFSASAASPAASLAHRRPPKPARAPSQGRSR